LDQALAKFLPHRTLGFPVTDNCVGEQRC
jgi:hypothetical protein